MGELAKDEVRPTVEETIRTQVDEMLLLNLSKIKLQISKADKKKGKGKKGKGKKEKPLPGAKIKEMKEMDADMMLSTLIENKLVGKGRNVWLKDWIGEFNYLGA